MNPVLVGSNSKLIIMSDALNNMMCSSPKPNDTHDPQHSLHTTLLKHINGDVKEEIEIHEEPVKVLTQNHEVSIKDEFEEPELIQNEVLSVTEEIDKKFSHNNYLMVTITDEKLYQCKQCDKCFSLNSHLITHQRTHAKEKPYQCNYCGKDFSVKIS
ncbi:unnamed protein product, partial [Meganyctiphanes norvegica]